MSEHSFGRTIVPRRVRVSTSPLAASARKPSRSEGRLTRRLPSPSSASVGSSVPGAGGTLDDVASDRIAHRKPFRAVVCGRGLRGLLLGVRRLAKGSSSCQTNCRIDHAQKNKQAVNAANTGSERNDEGPPFPFIDRDSVPVARRVALGASAALAQKKKVIRINHAGADDITGTEHQMFSWIFANYVNRRRRRST